MGVGGTGWGALGVGGVMRGWTTHAEDLPIRDNCSPNQLSKGTISGVRWECGVYISVWRRHPAVTAATRGGVWEAKVKHMAHPGGWEGMVGVEGAGPEECDWVVKWRAGVVGRGA